VKSLAFGLLPYRLPAKQCISVRCEPIDEKPRMSAGLRHASCDTYHRSSYGSPRYSHSDRS